MPQHSKTKTQKIPRTTLPNPTRPADTFKGKPRPLKKAK